MSEDLSLSSGYTLLVGKERNFLAFPVNLPASAGDRGSIPGLGRSPGGENGNPLQYSCLDNPMDRGAWWHTAHWVTKKLDVTGQVHISFSRRGAVACFIHDCQSATS